MTVLSTQILVTPRKFIPCWDCYLKCLCTPGRSGSSTHALATILAHDPLESLSTFVHTLHRSCSTVNFELREALDVWMDTAWLFHRAMLSLVQLSSRAVSASPTKISIPCCWGTGPTCHPTCSAFSLGQMSRLAAVVISSGTRSLV